MDELREENQRLRKELSFERQLSECLAKIRQNSLDLINNCKCNQNIDIFHDLIKYEKRYHSLKGNQNVDTILTNDKTDNVIITSGKSNEPIFITAKTPSVGRQLCNISSIQLTVNNGQTCGQLLATDSGEEPNGDLIEPNVVSIDLNNGQSVQQNTYPIVSADNGVEEHDETQETDKWMKQEIIDIPDDSEDSDNEDMIATAVTQKVATIPVTRTVPTATVHHYPTTRYQSTAPARQHNTRGYRYPNIGHKQVHHSYHHRIRQWRPPAVTPAAAQPAIKSYPCPYDRCGRRFQSTDYLNTHIQRFHTSTSATAVRPQPSVPMAADAHRCQSVGCDRTFASIQNLKKHMEKVHSMAPVFPPTDPKRPKPYRCPYVGCNTRGYTDAKNLKSHIKRCLAARDKQVLKINGNTDPIVAKTSQSLLLQSMLTAGTVGQTSNRVLATYGSETGDHIIEPNVVSIDLNPTESVKRNTYPIVSADNGLEVLPPIGDDGTQAADNQLKAKEEIIDILDDSDSEDTTATPVTPMVPTATVNHLRSASVTVNQTADLWLQNSLITQPLNKPTRNSLDTNSTSQATAAASDPEVYLCLECRKTFTTKHGLQTHNGMFHRNPVDQLHASGDQQSAVQMAGHITAGILNDFTPITVVHNSSQSNGFCEDNAIKKRSLMIAGTNETQVVDNETTQEIIDLLDSDSDGTEDTTD
ncbi:unnamed protein product, partial [Medioppia subpectinata]